MKKTGLNPVTKSLIISLAAAVFWTTVVIWEQLSCVPERLHQDQRDPRNIMGKKIGMFYLP